MSILLKVPRTLIFILFIIVLFLEPPSPLAAADRIAIGKFLLGKEANGSPKGWKTVTYFNTPPTSYKVVKYRGRYVLKAEGIGTSSSLFREVKAELNDYPIISWRWKISNVIRQAIETQKDRNDSAARVIVVFRIGMEEMPPWYGLKYLVRGILRRNEPIGPRIEYIWGNKIEKGQILDNPSVKQSKVIILESGERKANRWIWEKRNLLDDYKAAFGTDSQGILGLGIQTDTDQSNEGVTAYYGEIFLRKR
ncbi:MAG: DUF3047 domain-containing protein [Syntrophobacterales bacterium]|nr:MAG: DUF3047 domain-containing protein [Syntrophobacterales bacterium]